MMGVEPIATLFKSQLRQDMVASISAHPEGIARIPPHVFISRAESPVSSIVKPTS
jgi:hypothetical protein